MEPETSFRSRALQRVRRVGSLGGERWLAFGCLLAGIALAIPFVRLPPLGIGPLVSTLPLWACALALAWVCVRSARAIERDEAHRPGRFPWTALALAGLILATATSALTQPPSPYVANNLLPTAIGGLAFLALRRVRLETWLSLVPVAAIVVAVTVCLDAVGLWLEGPRSPGGIVGNRSHAGQYLTLALPAALAICRGQRSFLLAPVGVALGWTRSRTGWIGALVGAAAYVSIVDLAERSAVLAPLGVVLAGALAAPWLPSRLRWVEEQPYYQSLRRITDLSSGSGLARLDQYRFVWQLFRRDRAWWSGYGPSRWVTALHSVAPDAGKNPVPHSDYLLVLVAAGIPGLLWLLALLGASFRQAWRLPRSKRAIVWATLVELCLFSMADSVLYRPADCILIFGLIATASHLGSEE